MAQVSMTVRLDSQLKKQFNELCNEIGMSVNTAINVFVNAAVKTRGIPFEIKSTPKEESMSGLEAFRQIRQMAESGNFPDLTLDEINEEIRLAREEMKVKKAQKTV